MNRVHGQIAKTIDGRRGVEELARVLDGVAKPEATARGVRDLEVTGLVTNRGAVCWRDDLDDSDTTASLLGLLDGWVEVVELRHDTCPAHFAVAIPSGELARERLPHSVLAAGTRAGAGCGFGRAEALLRALGEAAEFASACYLGDGPAAVASVNNSGSGAVDPASITLISEAQYRDRARWNQRYGHLDPIPPALDRDAPIGWLEATALGDGVRVLVPAACTWIGYPGDPGAGPWYVADSNGCAAGVSLGDATVRAVLELVERDATAIWWYGRHPRPEINPRTLDEPAVAEVVAWHESTGRSLHLLDLTSDIGVPVVAAVTADRDGGRVLAGYGADFEASLAARAAFREVLQMEMGMAMVSRTHDLGDGAGRSPLEIGIGIAGRAGQEHLRPKVGPHCTREAAVPRSGDPVGLVSSLCERRGIRPCIVDLTRADIGVACVRGFGPGLRHYRRRLAPGRLFDVPVVLGWHPRAHTEPELNPVPLVL